MLSTRTTGGYYLHLLRAAVLGFQPDERPETVSWRELLNRSISQGTEILILQAVRRLSGKPPADIMEEWLYRRAVWLGREAAQEAEAKAIMQLAAQLGYPILPLKGLFFKHLYPKPWMRQMSDIDFLCPGCRSKEIVQGMQDMGYQIVQASRQSKHVSYLKPPFVKAELHDSLFRHGSKLNFRQRPEELLNSGHPAGMRLEDRYLHLVLHALAHFRSSGLGIRPVIDLHLFVNRYGDVLEWNLIEPVLQGNGALVFARRLESLATYLFSSGGADEDPVLDDLAAYLVDSGLYGNTQSWAVRDMVSHRAVDANWFARLSVQARTVFPGADYMSQNYPVLKRARFLTPLFWPVRWLTVLFRRPGNITPRLKGAGSVTNGEINRLRSMIGIFELDANLDE